MKEKGDCEGVKIEQKQTARLRDRCLNKNLFPAHLADGARAQSKEFLSQLFLVLF